MTNEKTNHNHPFDHLDNEENMIALEMEEGVATFCSDYELYDTLNNNEPTFGQCQQRDEGYFWSNYSKGGGSYYH